MSWKILKPDAIAVFSTVLVVNLHLRYPLLWKKRNRRVVDNVGRTAIAVAADVDEEADHWS